MKSFKQYIKESMILEGGNAVADVGPLPQKDVPVVLGNIEKDILNPLGLTKRGVDWETLGSLGKKKGDSGDIDIVINMLSLISNNKEVKTFDDVIPFIKKVLDKNGLPYKHSVGIGVLSMAYPVPDRELGVQTDLMVTDNMDFSTWAFWSANESETRFKKMGLYRNTLLQSIASEMKKEIIDQFDDGTPKEVKKYVFALDKGVYNKVSSYVGKKGQPVKTAKVLFRGEPNTNVEEIIELLLGKGATREDTNTFETVWAKMQSPSFPYKSKMGAIKKYAINDLTRKKMPIPSELE